jgi:hypothetical protein
MRYRFHEPRSDTPSPRRLDDVNANKSLYGNKRETPSIRCHEPAHRRGRGRPPCRPDRRGRETGRRPGWAAGRRRTSAGLGGRETTDVGRLDVRETGYIGRAGRLGDGFTSAGPDVRETTDVGRPAGCPGDGPLGRPRREWSLSSVARAKRLLSGMQEIRDASGTAGRAAARRRDGSRSVTWAKAMAVETG